MGCGGSKEETAEEMELRRAREVAGTHFSTERRVVVTTEPAAHREAAAAWLLLIRQTDPTYLTPPQTAWRLYNSSDPNGDNYSILETLDDRYRMLDGKFKFKLVYPQDDGYVIWRQRSNPMTSAEKSIEGVEFLHSKGVTTGFKHHNDFCGLRSGAKSEKYGRNWTAIMNGSQDGWHWSYAVGSGSKWGRGIPASCNGGHSRVDATTQVELYVCTRGTRFQSDVGSSPGAVKSGLESETAVV